ncbi:hypothetical protein N9W79_01805, partial [bacterium]|nr:hypothetical protein [bacterium]
ASGSISITVAAGLSQNSFSGDLGAGPSATVIVDQASVTPNASRNAFFEAPTLFRAKTGRVETSTYADIIAEKPADVRTGQKLYIIVSGGDTVTSSNTVTFGSLTGWTKEIDDDGLVLYSKIADGTEGSTETITHNTGDFGGGWVYFNAEHAEFDSYALSDGSLNPDFTAAESSNTEYLVLDIAAGDYGLNGDRNNMVYPTTATGFHDVIDFGTTSGDDVAIFTKFKYHSSSTIDGNDFAWAGTEGSHRHSSIVFRSTNKSVFKAENTDTEPTTTYIDHDIDKWNSWPSSGSTVMNPQSESAGDLLVLSCYSHGDGFRNQTDAFSVNPANGDETLIEYYKGFSSFVGYRYADDGSEGNQTVNFEPYGNGVCRYYSMTSQARIISRYEKLHIDRAGNTIQSRPLVSNSTTTVDIVSLYNISSSTWGSPATQTGGGHAEITTGYFTVSDKNVVDVAVSYTNSTDLDTTDGHASIVNMSSTNNYFTTQWLVQSGDTIDLPLPAGYTYNFTVDWGDGSSGTVTSNIDGDKSHTYSADGIFEVKISGTIEGFDMTLASAAMKEKLLAVTSLGNVGWQNLDNAFNGASNLKYVTIGFMGDTSPTSMDYMFKGTGIIESDFSQLNLSSTTSMVEMFADIPSGATINLYGTGYFSSGADKTDIILGSTITLEFEVPTAEGTIVTNTFFSGLSGITDFAVTASEDYVAVTGDQFIYQKTSATTYAITDSLGASVDLFGIKCEGDDCNAYGISYGSDEEAFYAYTTSGDLTNFLNTREFNLISYDVETTGLAYFDGKWVGLGPIDTCFIDNGSDDWGGVGSFYPGFVSNTSKTNGYAIRTYSGDTIIRRFSDGTDCDTGVSDLNTWSSKVATGIAAYETTIAVFDESSMIVSNDTGTSWSAPTSLGAYTGNLVEVLFETDSTGYFVTTTGDIYKTTDSGDNWTSLVSLTPTGTILAMDFVHRSLQDWLAILDSNGDIYEVALAP